MSASLSLTLHAMAVVALSVSIIPALAPPPEQTEVVMVFAPPAETVSAPEPVAEPMAEQQVPPPPDLTQGDVATAEPIAPPAPPRPPPPRLARPVRTPATPTPTIPNAPIAPATTAPPPTEGPAVDAAWRGRLAAWLAAHKTYPDDARRRGEEGRVSIRFTVDRSGRVLDVELADSSGSDRLDRATLALLRGAELPAFPGTMRSESVTVTTTLLYRLR